ncbi:hypothetical protein HDV00_007205 [Rhizophlyctis rosea]|nr:hypothetical protein HDV00_007205 [Rhizophlyctis rosea]
MTDVKDSTHLAAGVVQHGGGGEEKVETVPLAGGGGGSLGVESTNLAGPGVGRFRSDPLGFMLRLSAESVAFYRGEGWRAYENYIGARIFYQEYSDEIRTALMHSPTLNRTIKTIALQKYDLLVQKAEQTKPSKVKRLKTEKYRNEKLEVLEAETRRVVDRMVEGMVAEMNSLRSIRFIGYVINNVLARMYHQGIHFGDSGFSVLRRYAQAAAEQQVSLIILPCHKSHVDYLVISYIFYRLGLALPHIAAGDNLNLPAIGPFLRHGGAFFIRRQWGDDVLYNTLMREYIELLLKRGHNIEAFIEGTRSRIGKLLQPKFGILKIILDAVMSGRVRDAILVPMSIGYDKVIETESFVNELMGRPKEKESIAQLLGNLNILSFTWGRIDIRFAKPYSLREYLDRQFVRRGPEFDPTRNTKDRVRLLQALGYRILSDINAAAVTMPTALVGTILVTLRGRGVGRSELIRKVNWLKREIMAKGGTVNFGSMSTAAIVDRAVQVLKELIGTRLNLLEPVYYPIKEFELSYYRNQVMHLFIREAILSVAMYSTVKAGGPVHSQRCLYRPTLLNDVSFISNLLKSEFIYGPGGLERNFEETVEGVWRKKVIAVEGEGGDGRVWVSLSREERGKGRETFDFYCFLMWPFIETYWLAAVSLFTMVLDGGVGGGSGGGPLNWVDERLFMNRAQQFGKTLYYEGDLSYFESINKETFKNALSRLCDMGVILTHKGPTPPPVAVVTEASASRTASSSSPSTSSARAPPFSGNPPKAPSPSAFAGPTVSWMALAPEWVPPDPELPVESGGGGVEFGGGEYLVEGEVGGPPSSSSSSSAASASSTSSSRSSPPTPPTTPTTTDHSSPPLPTALQHHPQHHPQPRTAPWSTFRKLENGAEWDPWHGLRPRGKLWQLCEDIGRFRREGKNRRDTGTVAIRVLRLAMVAREWSAGRRGGGAGGGVGGGGKGRSGGGGVGGKEEGGGGHEGEGVGGGGGGGGDVPFDGGRREEGEEEGVRPVGEIERAKL